jgi:hypothetical protein
MTLHIGILSIRDYASAHLIHCEHISQIMGVCERRASALHGVTMGVNITLNSSNLVCQLPIESSL